MAQGALVLVDGLVDAAADDGGGRPLGQLRAEIRGRQLGNEVQGDLFPFPNGNLGLLKHAIWLLILGFDL